MRSLFSRELANIERRFVLLAPPQASIPKSLNNVTAVSSEHRRLLRELQRFRGSIYLQDGAIRPEQLTVDGRHETPEDESSWHVLLLDDDRRVNGCIWYREHEEPSLDRLRIQHCALADDREWEHKFRSAINREIARAERDRVAYAEVGGWAVACGSRCLSAALMLVLGTYSLSQAAGGALVIATATVRHSSSKILRRLGGSLLEGEGFVVPRYYDPNYECDMELLRFDTRKPEAKYAGLVKLLRGKLAKVPVVVAAGAPAEAAESFFGPWPMGDSLIVPATHGVAA